MEDHEPGMRAGMRGEKRRQTFAQIGIHEPVGPAFADAHQISESDRGIIEGQSQRRAVEIAAGKDVTALSENKRVIGRGGGFYFQELFAMLKRASNRAVDLRHAPQAVGILDPRIIIEVRFANLALAQKMTEMVGYSLLAGVWAGLLDAGIKSGWCSFQRLETHRAGDVRDLGQPYRTKQGEAANGMHP